MLSSLLQMPEWYLVLALAAGVSVLGLLWPPLMLVLPVLVLGLLLPLLGAVAGGRKATFANAPRTASHEMRLRTLTAFLHILQPIARLWGRLHSGLTPWRHRVTGALLVPGRRNFATWRAYIMPSEGWLAALEEALRSMGATVASGGEYDRWDLEVRGGVLGSSRLRMVIEDHGASKQLIRFRVWPRVGRLAAAALAILGFLALDAAMMGSPVAASILAISAALLGLRTFWECSASLATTIAPLEQGGAETDIPFSDPVGGPSGAPELDRASLADRAVKAPLQGRVAREGRE
jgi:hypothetical protein